MEDSDSSSMESNGSSSSHSKTNGRTTKNASHASKLSKHEDESKELHSTNGRSDGSSDEDSEASSSKSRSSSSSQRPEESVANSTTDFFPKDVQVRVASPRRAWPEKNAKLWITSLELANLQLAVKYVITDTKRHKRAWLIGFFTVFLVVWFVSLLQASIAKSPIVFLKLSEDQVGEYDLVMTPTLTNDVQTFWLNYTEINERLKTADLVKGSVPRWVLLGKIFNAQTQKNTSTAILIIDSEKEDAVGIGRAWDHKVLTEEQTHVSSSVLRTIGVNANAGETITLQFDFLGLASSAGAIPGGNVEKFLYRLLLQNANFTGVDPANVTLQQLLPTLNAAFPGVNITGIISQIFGGNVPVGLNLEQIIEQFIKQLSSSLIVRRNYLVMDGLDSPGGKFPKVLGNVALLESKGVYAIIDQLVQNIKGSNLLPNPTLLRAALPFFNDPQQREIVSQIIDALESFEDNLDTFQRNFRVDDFALTVVVSYKKRFETYIKPQKPLDADMIVFTNQVADAIGFTYPATFSLPLQAALVPLYFIRLFLDQIFTFVVVVLIVLGGLLIYSLLLSNVEEKTYEYGMLRALGMKQYVLIELLFTQSLSFSVPAIATGLTVGFLAFIIVAVEIAKFALAPIDVSMDSSSLIIATLLGLFMPIVSIIGPIQRALSRTLRDALDIYHQVQSETAVRIVKLEELGLSPWQVSASLMMIIMGFVVYYLIPYTFTFGNLPLFFTILILILLGMLFGLSLIGTMIQPFAEKLAIYVILWGEDYRSLNHLVRKNLSAHGRRNIKTAVMFTTALAFIIFAGSSFSLQGHTISEFTRLASGGDIVVFSPFTTYSPLNEDDMRNYLETEMRRENPLVLGFTFATFALDEYRYGKSSRISNLAGFPNIPVNVYGLEENYLDETYVRFYRPTELSNQFKYQKTTDKKDNAVRSLYTDAGKAQLPQEKNGIRVPPDVTSRKRSDKPTNGTLNLDIQKAYTNYVDVIISEATRLIASIDTSTPLKLSINFVASSGNSSTNIYLAKARALVQTFPGFFFSSYRASAFFSPVLISMDQYYRLMREIYEASSERDEPFPSKPDKMTLRVHMKNGATKKDRETVANGLRNFISDDLTQLLDTADLVSSTDMAINLLNLFFNLVSIIAVVLCFFVLWLSFTANVNENSWEFGVLRAVGLDVGRVIRMYIYEALCLIVSSVIIGATIGMMVSITLTLQFNLFTELAFSFDFPYSLFFSVFGMSILVAIFGSYIPAAQLKTKDIAIALKNM